MVGVDEERRAIAWGPCFAKGVVLDAGQPVGHDRVGKNASDARLPREAVDLQRGEDVGVDARGCLQLCGARHRDDSAAPVEVRGERQRARERPFEGLAAGGDDERSLARAAREGHDCQGSDPQPLHFFKSTMPTNVSSTPASKHATATPMSSPMLDFGISIFSASAEGVVAEADGAGAAAAGAG